MKYRYRVRVTYDAILESDFPDDFTLDDVKSDVKLDVEEQDVLFFGSDFDPDISVTDVYPVSGDSYSLACEKSNVAYVTAEIKVANNLNCIATVRAPYCVNPRDEGSYDLELENFTVMSAEFYDDEKQDVLIDVDVAPLLDSTKIEELIRNYCDRGVH